MLSFLAERSRGTHRADALSYAEATRRAFSLELSKGRDVQKIHRSGVNSIDIDPVEWKFLLSGASDGVIGIYDIETLPGIKEYTCPVVCTVGKSNRYIHNSSVETVQWYPHDSGMFISSGMDHKLKIWDTNALVPAEEFPMKKAIYSHHMSPIATKHCLIAVGTLDNKVNLCDLKSGSSTHILKGHREAVVCVQWSNKQEFLLASGSRDSRVLLWDVRHAKGCLMSLDQHNGQTSKDSSSSVNTAHSGDVTGLCFSGDGLFLITFGTDDKVRLWDVMSGKNTLINFGRVINDCQKSVKITSSIGTNPCAAFIPSTSDIDVHDIHNGEKVYELKGHYHNVNCCVFHPHTQELYSGSNDSNILIWEPDLGRAIDDTGEEEKVKAPKGSIDVSASATADAWSSDEDD